MDPTTLWMMAKPILAGQLRHALGIAFGYLLAHGALQSDQQSGFIEIGMSLAGWAVVAGWSWWNGAGKARAGALLQKMTGTDNHKDAVDAAKALPASAAIDTPNKASTANAVTGNAALVLIAAFVLSAFLAGASAMAQTPLPKPRTSSVTAPISGNALPCDPARLLPGCSDVSSSATSATGGVISKLLSKPMQDLADFIAAGFDDAVSLSTAVPELQDGNGQACWSMMKNYSAVLKQHPIPVTFHASADLESIRLLNMAANKICQNAACTQVFTDAGNLIGAALPLKMPLPNLTVLCSQIPGIAIVTPMLPIVPSPSPTPSVSPSPVPSASPTP